MSDSFQKREELAWLYWAKIEARRFTISSGFVCVPILAKIEARRFTISSGFFCVPILVKKLSWGDPRSASWCEHKVLQ